MDSVAEAVNAAAAKHQFRCVPVSWEDAQRGTVGGNLSCWGGNISDVRLWEKTGKLIYTCRSENWNERLGYVAAKDVAVVVGNHVAGGSSPETISLKRYLQNFRSYAAYCGVTSESLFEPSVDDILTIRFQTVFLPLDMPSGKVGRPSTNFCTEVYNYNSQDDARPRNVLLLCSAQGTSVQTDGSGAKRVFHHEVEGDGTVHRYWLEAEKSSHAVGGAQVETEEEKLAAVARGKSTAMVIGTRAMGTRFNVQMLIQVPVKQAQIYRPMEASCCYYECQVGCSMAPTCAMMPWADPSDRRMLGATMMKVGVSNAARVSRGIEEDKWSGVVKKDPTRDPSMHSTITVTMYYTVVGGVPSVADVEAAVADLNALYAGCAKEKRLVDCTEVSVKKRLVDSMKVTAELKVKNTLDSFLANLNALHVDCANEKRLDFTAVVTVKNTKNLTSKITNQPYQPPKHMPKASNEFPED